MSPSPQGATGGESPVVLGKVSGVFGIKGWVKVHSFTRPRENLLEYPHWLMGSAGGWKPARVVEHGVSGGALTVHLQGVDDRDAAQRLVGVEIAVRREALPALPAGQYYWSDLVGLRVVGAEGLELGRVAGFFETGANDVMEVKGDGGRWLVPFVPGHVVTEVDREAGVIRVDWVPGYQ